MFSTKTRNKTIAILALFVAFAVVFGLLGFNKISVNASQAEVSSNTENSAPANPSTDNENVITATIVNGDETNYKYGNEQQVEFGLPAAKNIDGYTFLGWNVGNEIYQANSLPTTAFISAENITATAIYAKLDFIGGGVRTEGTMGVRFKFELEVYNVTDQAVMNNVARTINGTFNLRTSQDNIAEVKGYKVDGNKIAMNAVVINQFDAKNKTEDKTFCDSDITVTLEIKVCGTMLSKTDKRSLTYISSVAYARGEITNIEHAEKYGCVVADLQYTEVKDETNTTVIGYSVFCGLTNYETATVAVIPKEYNGKPVTSIADLAFESCSKLTSVTIPDSVTSIGYAAFESCSKLTSITIPNSVATIENYAFKGCTGLTNITIPEGVTTIGSCVFEECTSLTSVTIPNSVTSIGDSAFKYCSKLANIKIPDSVTSIDGYAFYYCRGLTSLTIPDSVTSIGNSAFYYCTGLTSIAIPNSVTSIGNYAFYSCDGLTSITIPSGVTSISDHTFFGCSNLSSITMLDSVTSIGDYAFWYCTSLTSVTIPDSVTSIGNSAFQNCPYLGRVYYHGTAEEWNKISVNETGNENLTGATRYYYCDTEPTVDGNYWNYNADGSINAFTYTAPKATEGLKYTKINGKEEYAVSIGTAIDTDIVIPSTYEGKPVTSIGYCAFEGCKNLTSITIPDIVTSIGLYAFKDCTGLTSVNIPSNVTSIGEGAFSGCIGLISITIPDSVTFISEYAFYNCSGLTSVVIGNKVTSIGQCAFYYCTNLTSVTIPNSVTSIDKSAFQGCSSLTSVTIPNSVTSIGDEAFYNCRGLTSVVIGNGVKSISKWAFRDCTSLTSLTIGNKVTSIGEDAFLYCYKLVEVYNLSSLTIRKVSYDYGWVGYYTKDIYTSLDMPSKLSTTNDGYVFYENGEEVYLIGYVGNEASLVLPEKFNNKNYTIYQHALHGCSKLTSVTIPNSITSIGEKAFSNCTGLTSVIIPNGVTSIGEYAFCDCKKLTSVTIGESVASIGYGAFERCFMLVEVYNLSSLNITKGSYSNGDVGCYALGIYTSLDVPSKLSTTNDGYVFYENGEQVYLIGYKGNNTELTLPSNFNNKSYAINNNAFRDCDSITSVIIPNSVTSIGEYAFCNCIRLTSVEIPDSVTSIGKSVFSYSLKVYYKGTQEMWNNIKLEAPIESSIYYFSETEPALNADGSAYEGNYWHYDVDGVTPVIWKKQN